MTHVSPHGPDDAAFQWNRKSPTASRLAALMLERNLSVNALADKLTNGERTSVQRWLRGTTISEPNRVKLARYFKVPASDFAPEDKLNSIRPLLREVEMQRRALGLRPGTVVAELKRLAAR